MKTSSDGRYFVHTFPDYSAADTSIVSTGSEVEQGNVKFTQSFLDKLSHGMARLFSLFENSVESQTDWSDNSVYTGVAGYALLYYFLSSKKLTGSLQYTYKDALKYVDLAVKDCRGKYLTFLTGDAGPYAIAAATYHKLGNQEKTELCIKKLKDLADAHRIDVIHGKLPDEALYGRTGYLYALLFVKQEIGDDIIDDTLLKRVVLAMVASGEMLAKKHPEFGAPLMYQWHNSYYLGGAHGIAGILLYLLKFKRFLNDDYLDKVRQTVDFLLENRYPSGNFPSSIGRTSDKLVQWCHGAPGFTALLIEAAKVFGSPQYMEAAEKACDVIWERGLLTKGYGICHGAAGNSYSFLQMYQATKDAKYLYRAGKFAEFCLDHGKHSCKDPDRPMSMFEGLAGTLYFLSDLMDPENAKFPGF